ncbi:hypothetical protein C6A86_023570 [Mycobacterium sp. ITM-2016-00316]|uniref:hypothetical protein n=1 Tax=Mycobacterium sp. ITM-2016-00316 TaxID=2099695 RepID=UPI000CF8A77D|nr:hypothetical protein [Mycobacterium sp. ITM-2016-00316]WNG81141.1 hypothetical protein C6A86_023570 [Mycobacterium sp. ITM-2016-00316]
MQDVDKTVQGTIFVKSQFRRFHARLLALSDLGEQFLVLLQQRIPAQQAMVPALLIEAFRSVSPTFALVERPPVLVFLPDHDVDTTAS